MVLIFKWEINSFLEWKPLFMKAIALIIYVLNSSFIILSQTKQDTLLIDSLNTEAWSFLRKDPMKCLEKAKEVYTLAKSKSYLYGETKAMVTCGASFYRQSMQDSARVYFNKALKIAKSSNDLKGQANIYNNLGGLYSSMGMYSVALEYLKKSLEVKKKYGADDCLISSTYLNIATAYNQMEEIDKAIEVYDKARKLIDKDSCEYYVALKIASSIAYCKIGEIDKALLELEGSFPRAFVPKVLNNRGMCYIERKDYSKALDLFEKALILNRDSINSPMGMIGNYLNIAKVQTLLGQLYRAEESLNTGQKLLESVKFPELKIDFYKGYAKLYEAKGDFKKAYSSIVKSRELSDSLKSNDLDELQSNYFAYFNVQEKERELEQEQFKSKSLKSDNEKERIKSSRMRWIISLLMVILTIASVLYYRIRKNKKIIAEKNVQLNEEVERRKYFQERYNETLGRTLQAANNQSKREEIDLKRIVLVEKQKGSDAIFIHTLNGSIYTKVKPISRLINEELSDSFFTAVNKSVIVNLHYIESVNLEENKVIVKIPVLDKKKAVLETRTISLYKQGGIRDKFLSEYDDFVHSGGSE